MWWSGLAHAAVLDVGAGHPYATVRDAVVAARNGDVLMVHDPVVTDVVRVPRSILVVGNGATWEVPPGDVGVTVLNGAHLRIRGMNFSGDSTGIWVEDGEATVVESSFAGFGAGIVAVNEHGSLFVARTEFTDNVNAIAAWGGSVLEVEDSRFYDNRAMNLAMGAAITASGTVTVTRSFFADNGDDWSTVDCGKCEITDSVFLSNDSGGMPLILAYGEATLERNRFCSNESEWGGVVYTVGEATLRNNLFRSNAGGVLYATGSALLLEHNTFVGNTVPYNGVGLLQAGDVTMVGNLVAENDATDLDAFFDNGATTVTPSYNAWYDNVGGDTNFGVGATDLVGVDPLLPAAGACTWASVTPGIGSPLVDGDPTLLDRDGTAADIGATGGPAAP